jgi:hypothetical protein
LTQGLPSAGNMTLPRQLPVGVFMGPDGVGGLPGHGFTVAVSGLESGGAGQTTVESLGADTIGSVRAEGMSYRTIYPAQMFGNEKEIVVNKTTWYAPELQLMVRTEEVDPRLGTLTYELEVLGTAEPDSDLFRVPPTYRLIEPGREILPQSVTD